MKKIAAYGLSRNRDEKGVIVKRNANDYVNCIHSSAGGGYETMWILIIEVYELDEKGLLGDVYGSPEREH